MVLSGVASPRSILIEQRSPWCFPALPMPQELVFKNMVEAEIISTESGRLLLGMFIFAFLSFFGSLLGFSHLLPGLPCFCLGRGFLQRHCLKGMSNVPPWLQRLTL